MENEVVENQINEEPDVKISDNVTDALVFSVTYTNYINNIKNDKQNRTLGMWDIQSENFDKLKKLQSAENLAKFTAESEKQPELKPRIPGTTNNPFTRADLPNSRIRVGEN